ncbi:MAG TPA: histidine kinase [Aromatoleum sp.]|uniref:histidine kinase n=1 Tax=Aromatoleum sp. TaxID=2307007 RepID=UPI002B47B700|nr:histidine kinase [Aromatoleum sp.]HJV26371.1 histidine kinase [Aromatoleum sp.]
MASEAGAGQGAEEARLQAEIVRLNKIVTALMNRAERSTSMQGSAFSLFQTAVTLEEQVRVRTRELEMAVRENEKINRALHSAREEMQREIEERRRAQEALEVEKEEQRILIGKLEEAHNQLLQSEKLASIGQLAAGVAHEINNPIGFVNSNLSTLAKYVESLLSLIGVYEESEPLLAEGADARSRIIAAKEAADLDFMRDDVRQLIAESIDGASRVRRIVQDLRDFSRVDSSEWQLFDLREGIESTLNVAANEIKYKASVVRDYHDAPPVECIAAQINQVFLNLLVNAAQAIKGRGTITVRTGCDGNEVWAAVADDGSGIPPEILPKIFDPFFTTKPVGAGTGLGLSVSYGIVQKHGGRIDVDSRPGQGTTFTVRLPLHRAA